MFDMSVERLKEENVLTFKKQAMFKSNKSHHFQSFYKLKCNYFVS